MKNYYALILTLTLPLQGNTAEQSLSLKDGIAINFNEDIKLSLATRIQADIINFNDDISSLEDNDDFRRARIKGQLDIDDWRLKAEYDYGISRGWKNTFIQYRGLKQQRITIGNHTAPMSMEDISSSASQPFLERSITNALSASTLLGVSYQRWGRSWGLTVGAYGNELNNLARRKLPGRSLNSRFTYAPIKKASTTLHLGIASETRWIDDGERVRFRARPGSRLANRRLVDTRNIDGVDTSDTLGLEFAAAHKGLRTQVETINTQLYRSTGDINLNGYSVMISQLIGARDYQYSKRSGVFKAVQPTSPWGALELAARYAKLDLTDESVAGGHESELTLGLSWVINKHLRTTLNYTDITISPNRNGLNEDISLWSLRIQFEI